VARNWQLVNSFSWHLDRSFPLSTRHHLYRVKYLLEASRQKTWTTNWPCRKVKIF